MHFTSSVYHTNANVWQKSRRRSHAFYLLLQCFALFYFQLPVVQAGQKAAFLGAHSSRTNAPHSSKNKQRILPPLFSETGSNDDQEPAVETSFPGHLIRSLDLVPLMYGVAGHAGTRRGYQAILSLVKKDQETMNNNLLSNSLGALSRRKRAALATTDTSISQMSNQRSRHRKDRSRIKLTPIATSAEEARLEYELVEEATLALDDKQYNLAFPPLYGAESSPWDTSTIADTDNDEWLSLAADAWSLEHIIQAEQVIDTLINVKDWATLEDTTKTWMPRLSQIGLVVDEGGLLPSVLNDISGTVEIIRVRSLTDPTGKSTYTFRLKGDKFPILKLLRDKEEKLVQKGGKALDREVLAIQNEIDEVQSQIKSGLAQNVLSVSQVIDKGLDAVARLDVVFAKAAFGSKLDGAIPRVATEGRISIDGFLHPVLASADGDSSKANPRKSGQVVPIDLRLSSEDGDRALLISGPNGGGKTLSMKSFGLVCVLAKLGLPIPSSDGAKRPRVDFFDRILVNVGDQQSVMDGESTWTSTLNSCATMIEEVTKGSTGKSNESYLVLLDELGSGTDPEAGGAIAQAILEEFMSAPACHIVATTHSPRLKALSYESSDYNCATVLLESDDSSDYKRPSFRLEYGLIGESYALGAASRCTPALPESLLTRASQIMTESSDQAGTGSDYIRALTRSMEDQVERAKSERIAAGERAQDSADCRRAMMCLAASYENHLARLEQRLEDYYQKLQQQDDMEDLELVGKTLSELRLVKKQILSQKELLSERGLKLLPTFHELKVGESVVIVSEGEWDGTTMKVVADATTDENLGPTEVLVQASSSFLAWDSSSFLAWDNMFSDDMDSVVDSMVDRPLIVHRHELAIWDYDSVWEDEEGNALVSATSVPDSRRRLNSLLSTLKTKSPTSTQSGEKKIKVDTAFSSSRARKSANKGKGKKKRK